ncbi:14 kDa phosphohistidine phosphatase-like [Vespa crabro]|uniref:14 kDa phosphohistidine phosphatase-like n=1 Tax=Vespa crabro TaxID=7445 RepID=UPI001F019955|nr:14 kDa phosphohistidine phosphatase-like [Vespa crabro]
MILKSNAYILQFLITGSVKQLGASINTRWFATMSELLNKVPDVDIDANGKFKYMLLNIHDKTNDAFKPVVRGYTKAEWHDNVYEETTEQLKQYPDLEVESLGGGRILHDQEKKSIKVYGYSQGYGKADHQVTVELLKKKYTDYDITYSDDGY